MKRFASFFLAFQLVLSVGPAVMPVFAQTGGAEAEKMKTIIRDGDAECDYKTGKIKKECLNKIIANAIDVVFGFAGAVCILNILIAGYQISIGNVTGEGDTKGKGRLRWALLGFFFTAASFGIINAALDAAS